MAAFNQTTRLSDFPDGYIEKRRGDFKAFQSSGKIVTIHSVCQVWKVGVKSKSDVAYSNTVSYPVMKWTCGTLVCSPKVHQVSYFLEKKGVPDPGITDVSHLCHNRLCVNIAHLSLEPRCVNEHRRHCKSIRYCTNHDGYARCIFINHKKKVCVESKLFRKM